jgi:hypothetical protein
MLKAAELSATAFIKSTFGTTGSSNAARSFLPCQLSIRASAANIEKFH